MNHRFTFILLILLLLTSTVSGLQTTILQQFSNEDIFTVLETDVAKGNIEEFSESTLVSMYGFSKQKTQIIGGVPADWELEFRRDSGQTRLDVLVLKGTRTQPENMITVEFMPLVKTANRMSDAVISGLVAKAVDVKPFGANQLVITVEKAVMEANGNLNGSYEKTVSVFFDGSLRSVDIVAKFR